MSLLHHCFESEYLAGATTVDVILPDRPRGSTAAEFYRSGVKFKVLWLLHGTSGDSLDWVRRTNIELYAEELGIAVVMPSALNSNYSDWNDFMLGYRMYSYLTEELMPMVYGWLPASDRREDNFIAGLSMGGRGAVKYAVNHPELFAGAAVLSATPMDLAEMRPGHPCILMDLDNARIRTTLLNAGGYDAFVNSEENVWAILDREAGSGKLPRLFFACGEDDAMIYGQFCAFRKHAEEIGLDAEFFTAPGFRHEWRFWDLGIRRALGFFGLGEV